MYMARDMTLEVLCSIFQLIREIYTLSYIAGNPGIVKVSRDRVGVVGVGTLM